MLRGRGIVNKICEVAKKEYGFSKFYVWKQYLTLLFLIPGTTIECFGLLEQYTKSLKYNKCYINQKFRLKMEKHFAMSKTQSDILLNKNQFNYIFKGYGMVKRDYLYLTESNLDDVLSMFQKHVSLILKPTNLSSGRSVTKVYNIDEVKDFIGKDFMLEEVVVNHPDIAKYSNNSMNSIRFYSFIDLSGNINLLAAVIRIGGKDSPKDSIHGGGHFCKIDLPSGVIVSYGTNYLGEKFFSNYNCGENYIGQKIPRWEEAKNAVIEAHKKVSQLRFIGWDIAITSTGIELIEANTDADHGLLNFCEPLKYYFLKEW